MACSTNNSLATKQENNSIAQAEVAPQEGQNAQEQQEITSFNDDLAVIPEGVPGETPVPSFRHDQFTDFSDHSIISFLERSQLQSSFQWEFAQSGGASGLNSIGYDLLKTNDSPGLLVPSQIFKPMYLRKLDGFAGFKATAVFKLQVNSQPFMAGRLLMAATPMPTLLAARESYLAATISNLQCIHHVQMDIAKQTEVELRVPFISPYNCYDLVTGNFDWAKLYIKVYSPLNTTMNGTKLECLLWVHFENIELGFPTSAPLKAMPATSQSGDVKRPEVILIPKSQSGNLRKSMRNIVDSKNFMIDMQVSDKSKQQIIPASGSFWKQCKGFLKLSPLGVFPDNTFTTLTLKMTGGMNFTQSIAVGKADYGWYSGALIPFDFWFKDNITIDMSWSPPSNMKAQATLSLFVTYFDDTPDNVNVINTKAIPVQIEGRIAADVVRIDKCSLPLWVSEVPPFDPDEDRQDCPNINPIPQRLPMQQSGKVSKIPVRQTKSRAPPKEASNATVKKVRAQEQAKVVDSPAASSIKGWGDKIKSVGTSIVDGVVSVAAGIANFFGWSKPQLEIAGCTVLARPAEYFSNCDGADHSHVLGLTISNNIDVYPNLSGTDLDETSFEFLKRVPNFIGSFKYGEDISTIATNNILSAFLVTPVYTQPWTIDFNNFYQGDPLRMPTSLGYISSPFAYWTGSLVYTFRFVKTDYHSGRVEFSFHPFVTDVKVAYGDQGRYDQVYRVIVDLRENSEVSITVPYVSPQPWKLLEYDQKLFDPFLNTSTTSDINNLRYATGLFVVRKLTPLIVQNNIAPKEIECVVEVRAGDDYQVACPTHNVYLPFSFENDVVAKSQAGAVYATPGTSDTRTRALEGYVPPSITGNEIDTHRPDVQNFTMGEMFESFRCFTRRFNFSKQIDVSVVVKGRATRYNSSTGRYVNVYDYTQPSAVVNPALYIQPPKLAISQLDRTRITDDVAEQKFTIGFRQLPTPLSFVGGSFCFYRGGVRVKTCAISTFDGTIIPNNLTVGKIVYHRFHDPGTEIDSDVDTTVPHVPKSYSPAAYEQHVEKSFAEFQIPYYSPTMQSCHWNTKSYTLYDRPVPWLEVQIARDQQESGQYKPRMCIAAAGSDDLDFALYIGPAPVINSSATRPKIDTEEITLPDETKVQFGYYPFNNQFVYDADPAYTLSKQLPYAPDAAYLDRQSKKGDQYLWRVQGAFNLKFTQVTITFRQNLGPPPTPSN